VKTKNKNYIIQMKNEKISLKEYSKNLGIYICNMITDYVPILFSFYIFAKNSKENEIANAALIDSFFVFFFGFCYDFFEPVNSLCIPFLVKNNKELYALNVWKVGIFNIIFFICCSILSFFVYSLFHLSNEQYLINYLPDKYFLFLYIFTVGLLFTINNFLRGKS
jgi:hypothetical protein